MQNFFLVLILMLILGVQRLSAFTSHPRTTSSWREQHDPVTVSRIQRSRALSKREASRLPMSFEASSVASFCLEHSYLPKQSAIGGVFCLIGDSVAQLKDLVKNKDEDATNLDVLGEIDTQRSVRYLCKGLGGGVLWACWYQIADSWSYSILAEIQRTLQVQPPTDPSALGQRLSQTAVSILLEQFFVCPLMFSMWDIPLVALMSGTPARQIPGQVESKLGPLLLANAKVWTPVNLITYNIPVEYRVLYTSCADIFWQSINADITSQEVEMPEPIMFTSPQPVSSSSEDLVLLLESERQATKESRSALAETV